jgi:hypothetical protein
MLRTVYGTRMPRAEASASVHVSGEWSSDCVLARREDAHSRSTAGAAGAHGHGRVYQLTGSALPSS